MFRLTKIMQIVSAMLLLNLLAACSLVTNTPAAVPTQDPAIVETSLAVAKTQAVETVIAKLTNEAPVATNTSAPTETSAPTNTLAPTSTEIPTATMAPTFTPTATKVIIVNTSTPTATSTPKTITCTLTESAPANGADFKPNAPFDAAWTIKNSGSTTWASTDVDIRYLNGQKMHEGADLRDLGADVAVNGTFKLIFDMVAPAVTGRYTETWVLTQSGVNLCVMTVTIDVVP